MLDCCRKITQQYVGLMSIKKTYIVFQTLNVTSWFFSVWGRRAAAMQASGGGAGGAEGRDDQNSSRMRPSQSGSGRAEGEDGHRAPEGRGGPGRRRAAMEAVVARPRGVRAPAGLGPARDVAPLAIRPRCGQVVPTLRVPFQSPLEAGMAVISLLPDAQRHQGLIRKEFAVNGSDLLVRWTAEDLAFIRLSINPFLDQLSWVIRNTQRHGLPPRQSLGWGKGLRPNLLSPTRQGIRNSNYATLLSSNRHFVLWVYVFACTGLCISWVTCFVSLLLEEWDISVFIQQKINLSY